MIDEINGNIEKKQRVNKKDKEIMLKNKEVEQDSQSKFFVDLRKEPEHLQIILNLLKEANNKSYGREIILKDLVLAAIPKLSPKDIEKVQEQSLSEMERIQRLCDEFNQKNNLNLSLGEFLVKKFNL